MLELLQKYASSQYFYHLKSGKFKGTELLSLAHLEEKYPDNL
jgi:hypothetical protein